MNDTYTTERKYKLENHLYISQEALDDIKDWSIHYDDYLFNRWSLEIDFLEDFDLGCVE